MKQHDEELRNKIFSQLKELVPPTSIEDSNVLALAGDAAVPYLGPGSERDDSDRNIPEIAVRTLRLIGSVSAVACAKKYLDSDLVSVQRELCLMPDIHICEVQDLFRSLKESKNLPVHIDVRSGQQLRGAEDCIESISLDGSIFSDDHLDIAFLDSLYKLALGNFTSDILSNMLLPKSIKDLYIYRAGGEEIELNLDDYRKLSAFSISTSSAVRSINILGPLTELESFKIYGLSELTRCEALNSAAALRKLELVGCNSLPMLPKSVTLSPLEKFVLRSRNLPPLGGLAECANLSELEIAGSIEPIDIGSILSAQNIRVLTLEGSRLTSIGEDVVDLSSFFGMPDLRDLAISIPSITSVSGVEALSKLTRISIHCDSIDSLGPLGECSELRSLSIVRPSRKNLKELSKFRNLRKLVIAGANFGSFDELSRLSELEELWFFVCPNLNNFRPLLDMSKLRELRIFSCQKVASLTDLESLPNLSRVYVDDSPNLEIPECLQDKVIPSQNRAIWLSKRYFHRSAFDMLGGFSKGIGLLFLQQGASFSARGFWKVLTCIDWTGNSWSG